MTWSKTLDGRDVFIGDAGWFFDYQSQGWLYNPDLITVPQGAPVSAQVDAWVDRMTEPPKTPVWRAFLHPRTIRGDWWLDSIFGLFCFLVAWACRGVLLAVPVWIFLNAGEVLGDAVGFLAGWSEEDYGPGGDQFVVAAGLAILWVLAWGFLLILSLNPTQSNALTAAFVAHRMYDRFVHDVGNAASHGHHRHGYHGGSPSGHRPGS